MHSRQDRQIFVRRLYAAYRRLPHGERPTQTHVRIGEVLAHMPDDTPKHRDIAAIAGVCIRTVHNALARLHQLGLLTWQRRVLRGPGWRLQVASAYRLLSPKQLSFLVLTSSANIAAAPAKGIIPTPRASGPDLLKAARDRFEARLRTGWRPGEPVPM